MHDPYPRTLFYKHQNPQVKVNEWPEETFSSQATRFRNIPIFYLYKPLKGFPSHVCLFPDTFSCLKKMFYILGEIVKHIMSQVRWYTFKTHAIKLMAIIWIILHINYPVITNLMQINFSISHQIALNLFFLNIIRLLSQRLKKIYLPIFGTKEK